ncbi:DUF6194 family protein [Hoyosella subflava]|uniref:DUF6194 domain-containing protein n=1 Tax=Hoyosella subflava (strain DSM 45089 / JCM 17490 / NBRC 109087 / DQS3-9A1) TaxID=443218 RepID=F6EI78_HOYSD|nr:DUF6194 family protein [Hoyosella subflava]AEF41185.1 hypothetical protein AS9A_2738 [Hoyosella subflava DQS3-9A1]
MRIHDIVDYVGAMDGVLVITPQEGDPHPEIAWGDVFFFYAPDGVVPKAQPFATIVTKDYPDDATSHLNRPGAFRVNIAAGAAEFRKWTGHHAGEAGASAADPSAADTLTPHPVYGRQNWLSVVNPGPATAEIVKELIETAHRLARERFDRRAR